MRVRALCVAFLLWCGVVDAYPQCNGRNFIVQSIHLVGLNSVSSDEHAAISKSIIGQCFDSAEELSERIHNELQQHGFFKAIVDEPKLDVRKSTRGPSPVDVAVGIEFGRSYKLEQVSFTGAKAFTESQLRPCIPIASGEAFDTARIRQGLEALRDLYGEHGYINFTPGPDTQVDDNLGTIRLIIYLDEGPQLRVARVTMLAPENVADQLYAAWPLKPGAIYNAKAVQRFATENGALLPPGWTPEEHFEISRDEQARTVSLRLSICPPDQFCGQGYKDQE
jgi:outer membrane protein assembly factor BamA